MGFDATGPMQQVIQDVRGRKGDATATCAAWPSDPLPAIAKAWGHDSEDLFRGQTCSDRSPHADVCGHN
jgi:hypothetical protein